MKIKRFWNYKQKLLDNIETAGGNAKHEIKNYSGEIEMKRCKLKMLYSKFINLKRLTSKTDFESINEKGGECKMNKTFFNKFNRAAITVFAFATILGFNAIKANAAVPTDNGPSIIVNSQETSAPLMSNAISVTKETVNVMGDVTVTNDADGSLKISGTSIQTKTVSGTNEVTISGADKLILNVSNTYTALSKLTINANEVTTGNTTSINMTAVGLTIKADKVTLSGTQTNPLEIFIRFLEIDSIAENNVVFTKIGSAREKVTIENVKISASEFVSAEARVTEKTLIEEDALGDDVNEYIQMIDGTTKYLVNVRPVFTDITLNNTEITAAKIDLTSKTEIQLTSKSFMIPLAVTVADTKASLNINGTSKLTATSGDINLSSSTDVDAKTQSAAEDKINGSIAVTVINSDSNTTVADSAILNASGNVNITSDNNTNAETTSAGAEGNDDKSGVFVGVIVITQDSKADVINSASITATDLNVKSTQTGTSDTKVQSGSDDEGGDDETPKDIRKLTVSDILSILAKIIVEDENGDDKQAVSDDNINKVEDKFNETAESATDEDSGTLVGNLFDLGTVKITVQDKDGKPVKGVTVKLDDGTAVKTAVTNDLGVADFGDVSARTYTVSVVDGIPDGYNAPDSSSFTLKDEEGYEGTIKLAEKQSGNQFVGAFAVVVVVNDNKADVSTTGAITLSGDLNINSEAVTNHKSVADAAGVEDDEAIDNETIKTTVNNNGGDGIKDITVSLYKEINNVFVLIADGKTNEDGEYEFTSDNINKTFLVSELEEGKYLVVVSADEETYTFTYANEENGKIVTLSANDDGDLEGQGVEFKLTSNNSAADEGDADPSTPGDDEETEDGFSVGTAVDVQIVVFNNVASLTNATVIANNVNVTSKTGDIIIDEDAEDAAATDNASEATANAGFSDGCFGLAGAICVNVFTTKTDAFIDNTTLKITGDTTVTANDKSNSSTSGNAAKHKAEDKDEDKDKDEDEDGSKDEKKSESVTVENKDGTTETKEAPKAEDNGTTGVGAGIAVSIVNNKVHATIGSSALFDETVGGITVDATSEGKTEVKASAGAEGGKAVTPVVALDVTYQDVLSKIFANENAINGSGDVSVTAGTNRENATEADAEATGEKVAVGASIAVGVVTVNTTAQVDREVFCDGFTVKATADNKEEVKSKAGANGADPDSDKKDEDSAEKPTDDDKDAKSEEKGGVDKAVNKVLSSGSKVSDGKAECPKEAPQKAETSEGAVTVAASITVTVVHYNNNSAVNADIHASGDAEITSENQSDISSEADGSAAKSKVGVGVAVSIQVGFVSNDAVVNGNIEASSLSVSAVMPEKEKEDESDETELESNDITVSAAAGAGASNVGVAGSVSINIIDIHYNADTSGDCTIIGDMSVLSNASNEIKTTSGASQYLEGVETTEDEEGNETSKTETKGGKDDGKTVGIGASFSMIIADTSCEAKVNENSTISCGGSMTVNADSKNNAETNAVAGEDGYDTDEKGDEGKITLEFNDSDEEKPVDGVKVIINGIEYTSQYGKIEIDAVNDKSYTVKIVSVPDGFKTPKQTVYCFTIDEEELPGYKQVISLEKGTGTAEDEDSKDKDFALDAAVSISIITGKVNAEIKVGSVLDIDGDLTVNATSENNTNTVAAGAAKAGNVAVGASVTVNIVYEEVNVDMAGDATVAGDASFTSGADTIDLSNAFATASGVDLDRYSKKFNTTIDKILSGDFGGSSDTEAKPEKNPTDTNKTITGKLNNDKDSKGTDKSISSEVLKSQNVKTQKVDPDVSKVDGNINSNTAGGNNPNAKEDKDIAVAAAIGTNIVAHKVTANISGTIRNATSVKVDSDNNNNFQTLGTGASVSKGNAIAVGVAVVVNNGESNALVTGSLINIGAGNGTDPAVNVTADTTHNMGADFKNQIAAQAIAGAGKGKADQGIGFAGAVAVIVSNSKNNAKIGEKSIIETDGDVAVIATVKSKLAARAWAASLSSKLFDDESETSTTPKGQAKGGGIGAAFAVIYANNRIEAFIENGATVTADSVTVATANLKVDSSDYEFNFELNGQISAGTGDTNVVIQINTTDDVNSSEELAFKDVVFESLELLNYLATNNYYVEAAAGAVDTSGKFAVGGSVAIVYFNNVTKSGIGDNVTINLNGGNLTVTAESDTNAKAIGGEISIGGKISVGVVISAFVNNDHVSATIGKDLTVNNAADIIVSADGKQDLMMIMAGASIAGTANGEQGTALAGVVSVLISNNKVYASIGNNATITSSGAILVSASNDTKELGIAGGAAGSNKTALGASIAVVVMNNEANAYIGDNAKISSGDITVTANGNDNLTNVVVNGSFATGGTAVAVSPSVNIVNTKVIAFIGGNHADDREINAGNIFVTANGKTDIFTLSGGAAVSTTKSAGGGSVQVDVFNKTVNAYIYNNAKIARALKVTVAADSDEKIIGIAVGLGGASSASVFGSIIVEVFNNTVTAYIGDGALIKASGDVSVTANDDMNNTLAAGSVSVSTSSVAIGISNADLIFKGNTSAYIGNGADVTGSAIKVEATTNEKILEIVIAGGVSAGSVAVSGAVDVVVVNQTTDAHIGNDATVIAENGDVTVKAANNAKLTDVVGNIAVGSTAGLGCAVDTVIYNKTVNASIGNGSTIKANKGSVLVYSVNSDDYLSVVIGIAGAGTASLNGSVVVVTADDNVSSTIGDNSDVYANGNVAVITDNDQNILTVVGSVSASGTAAIGASVDTIVFSSDILAKIGINTKIVADAVSTSSASTSGFFGNSKYNSKNTLGGIMVSAINNQEIKDNVVSGGASGTAAVVGSINVLVFKEKTIASMNGRATSKSDVVVTATDESKLQNIVGQANGSGVAGVGVASDTVTFSKTTAASIGNNAEINADRNVVVRAIANEDYLTVVAGAGGSGTASVNGSVAVLVINSNVSAYIGDNAKIYAVGSVVVLSDDYQDISVTAGAASFSGVAAVAAGVLVLSTDNHVIAYIGDNAIVDALGTVGVDFYTGKYTTSEIDDTLTYSDTSKTSANQDVTVKTSVRDKAVKYGVLVGAFNQTDVFTLAFSASGSGVAAVGAASATTVMDSVHNTRTSTCRYR